MTTAATLDRSGSTSFSIPDIVNLTADGSVRIPTFQRPFVWDAKDVRDLFDSLYRGFPIGTLLLWRHWAPAGQATLGPITLEVEENPGALWVVDGQQRITSLFASLSPRHSRIDERFEIYFDLATERFVNPRRGIAPPRSVPVRVALESRSLVSWLRHNSEELEPDDLDVVDRLGGALRDYKVPAYIVTGDNQALLREVFDRVNSAGKPIKRAEVFHALFANDEVPGSPRSVLQGLQSLGFGDLGASRVVQSVLALRGGNVQRDIRDEFDGNEQPIDWYDQTEQALVRVILFLRSQGIEHVSLMPYTLPIPVLAAFFHLHPESDPWVLRLLGRWLWRGLVHGFGREGGQTPMLRRAISAINPEHRKPEMAPSAFEAVRSLLGYVSDRQVPEFDLDNFNTRTANSRLILLALASLRPKASDGTPIDVAIELETHGAAAITEFVPGYRTHGAARGFWRLDDSARPATVADEDVLHSHALDAGMARSLAAGDAAGFISKRGDALRQLLGNYLDSRTEPGALLRPPLKDLVLAGAMEDEFT